MQGKTHKAMRAFFSTNFPSQTAVEWYIQSAEWETYSIQPRVFHLARLLFIIGEFPRHTKPVKFMTTKPDLQEILRRTLWVERRDQKWQYEGRKHKSTQDEYFCEQISVKELTE